MQVGVSLIKKAGPNASPDMKTVSVPSGVNRSGIETETGD